MNAQATERDIALSVFESISNAFPNLAMKIDLHPEHVDLAMDIPAQPGLVFDVHLSLQNVDELHISASAFWGEWFPCRNAKTVLEFRRAASGLLSGELRILEHWRGNRAVKAQLQRPDDGAWRTVATYQDLRSMLWPFKTLKVIQNLPNAAVSRPS